MSLASLKYILGISLLSVFAITCSAQNEAKEQDLNQLSVQFLRSIKNGSSTDEIRTRLYNTSFGDLRDGLKTNDEKLAFWVNIYNAYIQVVLTENPEAYNDKGAFFKAERIPVAGRLLSFEKIEHGILRKSQWPAGLGLIGKWFPNKFERKLRVDARDYRVHFALNCGAKDCPPIAIYEADRLDEQFKKATERYLRRTSEYDAEKKEIAVTALFNWFRGDFGCKTGIKKILKEQGIIPKTKGIKLTYANYDWTLDLDNWTKS